jgi:ABC-type cobalt transport system substrate-binding protein
MRSMRAGICIALLLVAPVVAAALVLLVSHRGESTGGAAEEVEAAVELLDRNVPATIDVHQPDRPIVGLILSYLRLADDDLATIAELPKLRSLQIGYNQFLTNACLRRLKKATSLRSLSAPWGGRRMPDSPN